MTPGFETEEERFELAARLGWLVGELRRAGWPHAEELDRITDILIARVEELEDASDG